MNIQAHRATAVMAWLGLLSGFLIAQPALPLTSRRATPSRDRSRRACFILEYIYSFLATARLVAVARRAGSAFAVMQACNPPDIFWPIGLALRARDRTRFVFETTTCAPGCYGVPGSPAAPRCPTGGCARSSGGRTAPRTG